MQVLDLAFRKSRMGRRFRFISILLCVSVLTFYLFGQGVLKQDIFSQMDRSSEEETRRYITTTIAEYIHEQHNSLKYDKEQEAIVPSYLQSSSLKSTPFTETGVQDVIQVTDTKTTTTTAKTVTESMSTPLLLVTYLRSGSTLTADIIAQSDDVFYIYEPLHSFPQQIYYTNQQICNISTGDCRNPDTELEDPNLIKMTLFNILTCQFKNLTQRIYFDMRFHVKRSKALTQYDDCRKSRRQKTCIDELEKLCHKKPIKSVKEIKITMDIVNWLMGVIPNLKIIHLLRDPRGMLASQKTGRFIINNVSMVSRAACSRLKNDVLITHKMSKIYPGRIKQILYEAIAENPVPSTKQLYDFLGLTVNQNITNYVLNITKSGNENNGYYNVVRGDSAKTAYRWRSSLRWRQVQQIDAECREFYELTGFKPFENELNYKEKSFKTRVSNDTVN